MRILFVFAAILAALSCTQKSEEDRFIDDLMGRMTLEQKIGQMNLPSVGRNVVTGPEIKSDVKALLREDRIGAVLNVLGADEIMTLQKFAVDSSSLHIPLIVGMDVVHGYRTIFPIPLAISSTWEPGNAEICARISAREATTQGVNWTYAPMVDIAHDARWGRIMEGSGEDPLLGADFARAYVRGFQGELSGAKDEMLACVKHYALYGASFGGLDYTAADMSRAMMFNLYMEPYRAAVEEGVATLMTSFNEVEGVPSCANEFLLQEVLRGMWGFEGFVVADYDAVQEMIKHGLGSGEEVTARAANAGLDMDMCSYFFGKYLPQLVREGKVKEDVVNQACRRILRAKYRLGLFEDPYRFCRKDEGEKILGCEEFRAEARKMAPESFVLLKNDGDLLPLKRDAKIALIGPYARETANVIGVWNCDGTRSSPVSLLQGLENAGMKNVRTAQGSNICYNRDMQRLWTSSRGMTIEPDGRSDAAMLSEAVALARHSDIVVAAVGESADLSGEGASRSDISIPDAQKDLLKALAATGKPVVLVLFTGRPLDLSWEDENLDAILNVWFPGTEAGNAIADVLLGDVNPSGHLTASFPRNIGQLPYFYNHTPSGRPFQGKVGKFLSTYIDVSPEPLYPFGYGLSYTSFAFGEPCATVDGGKVNVEVEVRNTGERAGKEVVQLYVRDVAASQARPVCELKGYEKVSLAPGESKTVQFTLDKEALSFYNYKTEKVFEPGEFLIMTGPNCRDTRSVRLTL